MNPSNYRTQLALFGEVCRTYTKIIEELTDLKNDNKEMWDLRDIRFDGQKMYFYSDEINPYFITFLAEKKIRFKVKSEEGPTGVLQVVVL